MIISFAIPAMGIWLCNPIFSMIDMSAVGLLAGTTHQAALSPAVAIADYSALLLAFLYTAIFLHRNYIRPGLISFIQVATLHDYRGQEEQCGSFQKMRMEVEHITRLGFTARWTP
jgi:hypothetical protein